MAHNTLGTTVAITWHCAPARNRRISSVLFPCLESSRSRIDAKTTRPEPTKFEPGRFNASPDFSRLTASGTGTADRIEAHLHGDCNQSCKSGFLFRIL